MWVVDLLVALGATTWVAATVLRHLPSKLVPSPLSRVVNDGVLAWLIPSWNFFAPVPGTHSYCLLYRDELADGTMDVWREIRVPHCARWSRFIWNPEKTLSKAVVDLSLELARTVEASSSEPALVRLSIPYLTALSLVTHMPHLTLATGTQFVVLQRSREEDRVLFLSGIHALE